MSRTDSGEGHRPKHITAPQPLFPILFTGIKDHRYAKILDEDQAFGKPQKDEFDYTDHR